MTGLPIVWGEGGVGDVLAGRGGPSKAYRRLDERFDLVPIDAIDADALARRKLMMLAQPRALAPGELFDLDAWVRSGGHILILTDPALAWPSSFGLGDPRRAPVIGLLDPLLTHWGLELAGPAEGEPAVTERQIGGRTVRLATPGRFDTRSRACRVAADGLVSRCKLGAGQALLVADADLLDDRLWADSGGNMAIIEDWLDELLR